MKNDKKIRHLKIAEPEKPAPNKNPDLRSVKARNFWNSCPLKLELLPTETCEVGKQSVEARDDDKAPCQWSINSPEDNYCFWKWVHSHSAPDGQLPPQMQSEIATLLNCSGTKVHYLIKQAVDKLKNSEYLPALISILEGTEGDPGAGSGDAEINRLVSEIDQKNSGADFD